MASYGSLSSWELGYVLVDGKNAAGAYYSFEWTSSKKSNGVTTVSWNLYGKGRTSSPKTLHSSIDLDLYIGESKSDLWTVTDKTTPTRFEENSEGEGTLICGNSFDITHSADGTASFTVKMKVTIVHYDDGHETDETFILDTNHHDYTVTFDSNGGSTPNPATTTVTYDGIYGTLPTVTRTGYSFSGWYTAASGGSKIESSTKVTITADQILYAHWEANVYKVTFNSNGGKNTAGGAFTNDKYGEEESWVNIRYSSHDYCTMLNNIPTRPGYEFLGWYATKEGGKQIYSAYGVAISGSDYWNNELCWIYAGDATFYAQWKPKADLGVKVKSVWREGSSFVKRDGVWKNGVQIYRKVDGIWKTR